MMSVNTISLASTRFFYQALFAIAILFLAYEAIDTGVHGLRYFWDYPAWVERHPALLLTHIGTGFIALMLGPWQFWKGFRDRYRNLHRWTGRVYLGTVAISSVVGLFMALTTHSDLVFRTGIAGLALAWMITATFGYLNIRKGFVDTHRLWMICNYVVTFGFVTYRLGHNYMVDEGYSPVTLMAWLCWVPQLSITVLILHLRESKLFRKSTGRFYSKQPVEA